MCDEWKDDFMAFHNWSYSNGYNDEKLSSGVNKLTIDRVDNDGNYCPENCRWVTQKTQSNNTRRNHIIEINGEQKTMQQWADEYNMSKHTFYARYAKGLRGKDLIDPVKKYRPRRVKNENSGR